LVGHFFLVFFFMFMFDNGLFATFIPQILMFLGYVSCLLAPGLFNHESATISTQVVTQVVTVNVDPLSVNTASTYEIHFSAPIEPKIQQPLVNSIIRLEACFFKSSSALTDGISFEGFSRPPPSFIA